MKVRQVLILSVLAIVCLPLMAWAGEFTVKKVIPVGPIHGGDLVWPARWSPDGSRIAFFSSGAFYTADTLGVSQKVTDFRPTPRRMEWSGNHDVMVWSVDVDSTNSRYDRLIQINITNGEKKIVIETSRELFRRSSNQVEFTGPYQTLEGGSYYEVKTNNRWDTKTVNSLLTTATRVDADDIQKQHVLRVGSDAVYLATLDGTDSVKISNKRYEGWQGTPLEIDYAKQYLYTYGTLIRLADDSAMVLGELGRQQQKATLACGFIWGSFCPTRPEIIGVVSCDDGHKVLFQQLAIVHLDNLQLEPIQDKVGLGNAKSPTYSPLGDRFLVISHGTLYIVEPATREGQ